MSNEFDPQSGRQYSNPQLSVGNKKLLPSGKDMPVRVIDSEVYNEKSNNVALSKSDFAACLLEGVAGFADFSFDPFRPIFNTIRKVIEQAQPVFDLPFVGRDEFISGAEKLDKAEQLGAIVDASIRMCKLAALFFAAATIRYYDQRIIEGLGADARKVRPIKKILAEAFVQPTLATVQDLARHCYHLIEDGAPRHLVTLWEMMAASPLLGPVGDLLDQIRVALSPSARKGRSVKKAQLKKPILEYLIPELHRYESRIAELMNVASASRDLQEADSAAWRGAVASLTRFLEPLQSVPLRVRNIERITTDGNEFVASLTTYRDGRIAHEELSQAYSDLKDDRLETYELLLDDDGAAGTFLDLYPFFIIKNNQLLYYSRTTPNGYEYSPVFGANRHLILTKRKFAHVALRATISTDLQGLFWTQVTPTTSAAGVRANIPARTPIVGRELQMKEIMEEIVQIPNRDG